MRTAAFARCTMLALVLVLATTALASGTVFPGAVARCRCTATGLRLSATAVPAVAGATLIAATLAGATTILDRFGRDARVDLEAGYDLAANLATEQAFDVAQQLVFVDAMRPDAAQHAVAVLRQHAHIAIDLPIPVRIATAMGEVLGHVDESAAQAARIDFLKTDQVVAAQHFGDEVQIAQPLAIRQQVLPALGHVFAIVPGIDTGLDVIAQ